VTRVIPTSIESSVVEVENKPIEIYEVSLDTGNLFFAAHPTDIIFGVQTYTAIGIQRSPIRTSLELAVDEVTITIDNINLFFSQRAVQESYIGKKLVVKKCFLDQLDSSSKAIVIFEGRMDDPVITETTFQIKVRSVLDALHVSLPRRVFSTLCNYQHYDISCTVSRIASVNLTTGTALGTGTSFRTLVSSALALRPDEYWAPIGTLLFDTGSNANLGREITKHTQAASLVGVGQVVTRIGFPNLINSGDIFTVTRGCKKTWSDCNSKFDNQLNYGGFPVTPKTPLL